jgi:2-polyprenyl-3-methyl-5-hydroxy-6-metoxy-1,4-benzoquinol methylase
MEKCYLTLQTSLEPEELRTRLKKWEPWSIRIDFSNGVSTNEFQRRIPFSEHPLSKFNAFEKAIPFPNLKGGRLLDIGCAFGYNSINVAAKYGLSCTGIDISTRHIDASRFLSSLAEVDTEFLIGNAETFSRSSQFDVVLHFGTLYHLPNPILSLQTTFDNLRPGGYLALETQVYDHPQDPNICYFMHMQNNDKTNFWALSTSVLTKFLELLGFREIREILKVVPKGLAEHMSRILLVARKPE